MCRSCTSSLVVSCWAEAMEGDASLVGCLVDRIAARVRSRHSSPNNPICIWLTADESSWIASSSYWIQLPRTRKGRHHREHQIDSHCHQYQQYLFRFRIASHPSRGPCPQSQESRIASDTHCRIRSLRSGPGSQLLHHPLGRSQITGFEGGN